MNPMPCQQCLTNYTQSVSASGDHVNTPFFDCTSDLGVFNGACASCVYNGCQAACSWSIFRGYLPPLSSPDLASQYLSGQDDDSVVKEWFRTPHPMANSVEVPGSAEYLSWENHKLSLSEMKRLAKSLWDVDVGQHRDFVRAQSRSDRAGGGPSGTN